MAIESMTGFARADGAYGDASWHWEIRSVNNRGLDVRLKLPFGYEALEPRVREGLAKRVTRGSINVTLAIDHEARAASVRVNEDVLQQVVALAQRMASNLGAEPPRVEALLALKGIVDVVDATEAEEVVAHRHVRMLEGLEVALDGLKAARASEGARLGDIIGAQIDEIARLADEIEASPARTPEAIRARLAEQVERLIGTGQGLDPQRLHQEAVMLATRADVDEELKRLAAHVAATRVLLGEGGPVGRKLDFLAQEFNREANTLTSKAADHDIARRGLALKVVIDQMREQVQNIE